MTRRCGCQASARRSTTKRTSPNVRASSPAGLSPHARNGHRLYRAEPDSFRVPAGAQSVVRLTRRDARLTPGVASQGKSVARLTRRDARLAPSVASEGKSVACLTRRDARLTPSVASEGKSVARDTLGFEGGKWGCHEAGFCRLHGC